MAFRKSFFLILSFFLITSFSFAEEFEDLEWELKYPEEILSDSFAQVKVSSGFYTESIFSEYLKGGIFFRIEPEMHFLVFDGSFDFEIKSKNLDKDFFFDIANDEPSDYFKSALFKYKELTFLFGKPAETDGKLRFLPYTDPLKSYSGFDLNISEWKFETRTLRWSNWMLGFSSPEITWNDFNFQLKADGFLDSSATSTYSVSLGPGISFNSFEINPFLSFESFQLNEGEELKDYSFFGGGVEAGINLKDILFKAGISMGSGIGYFSVIKVGPLLLNFGQRFFPDTEELDKENWIKIIWEYKNDNINTYLGFIEKTTKEGKLEPGIFSDIEIKLAPNWAVKFHFEKGDFLSFSTGVQYQFVLGEK